MSFLITSEDYKPIKALSLVICKQPSGALHAQKVVQQVAQVM